MFSKLTVLSSVNLKEKNCLSTRSQIIELASSFVSRKKYRMTLNNGMLSPDGRVAQKTTLFAV